MAFRQIRLPDPPQSTAWEVPEIFNQGLSGAVIHRAMILGNGASGAEHQCIGLVRALGLGDSYTFQRVTRPSGHYNYFLRWLPLHLHRKVDEYWRHHLGWLGWVPMLLGVRHSPKRLNAPRSPRPHNPGSGSVSRENADPKAIADKALKELELEGPLLVVACGRDTAVESAAIKEMAPSATFVVQIQHPRCDTKKFDMVIAPAHDFATPEEVAAQNAIPDVLKPFLPRRTTAGKNVVQTVGALHHADNITLRRAAADWHDDLVPLPKPLIAVCVGGPTGLVDTLSARGCNYDGEEMALQLANSIKRTLSNSGGSVRISTSRRTPLAMVDRLRKELQNYPRVYIWDGRGSNPHLGHLAWADAFIVTADSISMISEACSTGKPVYVVGREKCRGKFATFHDNLKKRRCTRPFTGAENMRDAWSYPPLNDTIMAAARVREAVAARGWTLR